MIGNVIGAEAIGGRGAAPVAVPVTARAAGGEKRARAAADGAVAVAGEQTGVAVRRP